VTIARHFSKPEGSLALQDSGQGFTAKTRNPICSFARDERVKDLLDAYSKESKEHFEIAILKLSPSTTNAYDFSC
jgi:hypothetical protein